METKTKKEVKRAMQDAAEKFQPPLEVLVKLGSLAVHVEEYFDSIPGGAASVYPAAGFDVAAMRTLLNDAGVMEWRARMDSAALLPKKRPASVK